jgi:hypothetical protein
MGMTKINSIRVSKYSIKAIKVGVKVGVQMREEFEQFNSEHVDAAVSSQLRMGLQRY